MSKKIRLNNNKRSFEKYNKKAYHKNFKSKRLKKKQVKRLSLRYRQERLIAKGYNITSAFSLTDEEKYKISRYQLMNIGKCFKKSKREMQLKRYKKLKHSVHREYYIEGLKMLGKDNIRKISRTNLVFKSECLNCHKKTKKFSKQIFPMGCTRCKKELEQRKPYK